jgi:hypothetical protein
MKTGSEIDRPLRKKISDKEFVKDYIRQIVGDQYNVPTLAILRQENEAISFSYPDSCVIKPTHLAGEVIFCRGNETIERNTLRSWFHKDLYVRSRQRNYKDLIPKIIVEPFVFGRREPEDYKVFCWHGRPRLIQVDLNRFGNHKRAFYDTSWRRQGFTMNYPIYEGVLKRPESFNLMLRLAAELSSAFSFVRVDLYAQGTQVRVGELTNCPEGGNCTFDPPSAEAIASNIIFGDYRVRDLAGQQSLIH